MRVTEKDKKMKHVEPKKPYTLPILFALSLVLNYGQFTGWVKIQNPRFNPVSEAQAEDALPEIPRGPLRSEFEQ